MRFFQPEIRLKTLVTEPGGLTAATAVARADDRIEGLREGALKVIATRIDQIEALGASAANADAIYRLANQLSGDAGTFGWKEVSDAAFSLCRLVARENSTWPRAAINLHVVAVRALLNPELAERTAERQALVAGLRQLSAEA